MTDGAAYHGGERRQQDNKRDWILRNNGWTVKRFYGTTIHNKAGNCSYVVKKEVRARRDWAIAHERARERRRKAWWEAVKRPFRRIAKLLRRNKDKR